MEWITSRIKEPSSWAAVAAGIVGIGVLISQPIVTIVGIVVGGLGFLLKEKGVRRLKYFPTGHVKKSYAVLPRRILQDQIRMKKLLRQSIGFTERGER